MADTESHPDSREEDPLDRIEDVEALVAALDEMAHDATVFQRIVAIIDALPAIGKTRKNEQQGFMFRGHDDVMAALNPLLARHGVFVVPRVLARKTAERKTSRGGTMYEVNLHVEFAFYGAGGDLVVASTWGEGTDSGDKATSKAHTMAFKSALAVVFAISTHELSDADATSPEETTGRGGRADSRRSRSEGRREFDPGVDVHPDAPQGEGFQARIATILGDAAPGADWRETLRPFVREKFGVETRDEIEDLTEYWRRLANFAAKIAEIGDLTAFPPLVDRAETEDTIGGPRLILQTLAWAFGVSVPEDAAVVFPEPVDAETTEDDIPFGPGPDPEPKGAGSIEPDAAPDRKQAALDDEAAAAAERDE